MDATAPAVAEASQLRSSSNDEIVIRSSVMLIACTCWTCTRMIALSDGDDSFPKHIVMG